MLLLNKQILIFLLLSEVAGTKDYQITSDNKQGACYQTAQNSREFWGKF